MAGNMLGRKNSVSTALIRIRCAGLILHRSERRTRPAEEPAHWHSARWPVLHSRWGGSPDGRGARVQGVLRLARGTAVVTGGEKTRRRMRSTPSSPTATAKLAARSRKGGLCLGRPELGRSEGRAEVKLLPAGARPRPAPPYGRARRAEEPACRHSQQRSMGARPIATQDPCYSSRSCAAAPRSAATRNSPVEQIGEEISCTDASIWERRGAHLSRRPALRRRSSQGLRPTAPHAQIGDWRR